jgi:Carboxypeptidase regulatory-like domain/Domain of unknown function (DUF4214)
MSNSIVSVRLTATSNASVFNRFHQAFKCLSSSRVFHLGLAISALLSVSAAVAKAQCVSLTTIGSASTQNFDTLSNVAGSTTNNLTITGWFMTETGGGARDNEQYAVDTGGSTTGDTYSYGAAASTERALGQLRSGTLISIFGSCYTNNSGSTITSLAVAYNGEEWRLGTAGRTDQMNFEYSLNATDLVTGTWTNVAALNFVTPDTATVGAKNGNAAGDRTALSSTISSLNIANGATFWIRWNDTDASGADDGLAVDDFSITPQSGATAADSHISGRVVDANGNPVEGAAVRLNGTQNRLTVTAAEGNYHFDNVETNGFYTVTPARANFSFTPAQRSFSQLGLRTDAAFNASLNSEGANPLDRTEYFVRQQYVDFLNREPDEAGLNFWVNNIESCGADAGCREVKRIDTSAAFFLAIEFKETGYLVYRTYQVAFGDIAGTPAPVRLGEFLPDTKAIGNGVIVNQNGWEAQLETNQQAYLDAFVARSRFTTAYPLTMTPAEFVDRLFTNAGVSPADSDRVAAISEFESASTTADAAARARALRRVAENPALAQQDFSPAFVLMQYFGYLRRDADATPDTDFSGYQFWLTKLDNFKGNYQQAEMVRAFLVSTEYRGRFRQ